MNQVLQKLKNTCRSIIRITPSKKGKQTLYRTKNKNEHAMVVQSVITAYQSVCPELYHDHPVSSFCSLLSQHAQILFMKT